MMPRWQPDLWTLFTTVIAPFTTVLAEMSARGMRLDETRRAALVDATRDRLTEIESSIGETVNDYHRRWKAEADADLAALLAERDALPRGHPQRKILGPRITKARTAARRLDDGFNLESDDQWRRLLFTAPPGGLGLTGSRRTGKHKVPIHDVI